MKLLSFLALYLGLLCIQTSLTEECFEEDNNIAISTSICKEANTICNLASPSYSKICQKRIDKDFAKDRCRNGVPCGTSISSLTFQQCIDSEL